jgi:hypothetical protein
MSETINLITTLFIVVAISATIVWSITIVVTLSDRRVSAGTRHRFWGLSMFAVLVSPIAVTLSPVPRWIQWSGLASENEPTFGARSHETIEPQRPMIGSASDNSGAGASNVPPPSNSPNSAAVAAHAATAKVPSPNGSTANAQQRTTSSETRSINLKRWGSLLTFPSHGAVCKISRLYRQGSC